MAGGSCADLHRLGAIALLLLLVVTGALWVVQVFGLSPPGTCLVMGCRSRVFVLAEFVLSARPPACMLRLLAQGEALPLQYVTPKCQRIDFRLFLGGGGGGTRVIFDAAVDRDAAEVCKPEIKIGNRQLFSLCDESIKRE